MNSMRKHANLRDVHASILKRGTYGENCQFIDALALVVGLLHQVLIDVLEVRDRDIFLEVLIEYLSIVDQFNLLVCHI